MRGNDTVGGIAIGHKAPTGRPLPAVVAFSDGEYGRYVVYILASRKYGALYIGVTGNLIARVVTHREEWVAGFTSRYHIHRLVYFEPFADPSEAILREKRLKKWRRSWKIELIEKTNPGWDDLFEQIAV